jgi:ADP-ribosylglycohydrolase
MEVTTLERYLGSMLGLAAGDAVGAQVEFMRPGDFEPVTDMVGGGVFRLPAGAFTDDTSMALCLAQSLVERGGFDPVDQLERYLRWIREGYMSSTGRAFDVGGTCADAILRFEATRQPYCGSTNPNRAGNGSIMRLAPVPLFFAREPEKAVEMSAASSRTTHGAPNAVDGCRYLGALIVGAVSGASKEELLSPRYTPAPGLWERAPLADAIREIADGSFMTKDPPEIRGTGYVVDSLEAALWAFHRGHSFEEGLMLAVNLGDDADTTAAVYGQLAGAFYGVSAIPRRFRDRLAMRDLIEDLAVNLYELAFESQPG